MNNGFNNLREFGRFRLDVERQVLWCDGTPVKLPLKCIEVLIALTEPGNQVVTKAELLDRIWQETFVEESNLSRHVYLLRKTFEGFHEANLIETIPRRGYRFTGEVREVIDTPAEISIGDHSVTRTVIEFEHDSPYSIDTVPLLPPHTPLAFSRRSRWLALIGVLLFYIAGVTAWRYQSLTNGTEPSEIRSVAVLPFKTIDASSGNQHHGIGFADLLITRLTNVSELKVRPTSAVLGFGDQDSVAVGRKLAVDAVLEGTIYRVGEKIRVTTRLVRISDGSPIWSGEVEKALTDELKMQDEIALQVITALSLNLSGNERTALVKRFTESAEAYQYYVKGRYEWNKRTTAGVIEAERLFRRAIDRDPAFVIAYVGLADCLVTNPIRGEEALLYARKALELDPNLGEPHATLGFINTFHKWDWRAAENDFRRSIELSPNYATAHHWYAQLLAIEGRHEEAKSEMRRAIEINPVSHNLLADLGQIYYFNHEYDKAKEYCNLSLQIYPDFMWGHRYLHYIYLQTGEYEKAIDADIQAWRIGSEREGPELSEKVEEYTRLARGSYRDGGIRGYMNRHVDGITDHWSGYYMSSIRNAFIGEKEIALDHLEMAFDHRPFTIVFIKADPIFDNIRDEPQFKGILGKMKLQED